MNKQTPHLNRKKEGAALLVALWVLIILALITGSFAFEMKLESMLVSYQRKRFLAERLAYSGVEYARAVLDKMDEAKELEVEDQAAAGEDDDGFMTAALMLKQGAGASLSVTLGQGKFDVEITSAESGRNVNTLSKEEWKDIFEHVGVPNTHWDELIDCLTDWIDSNDLHQLNGAESDDPYYKERGYPVKNGPLDSVEELLLIKGWSEDILYGKPADDEGEAIVGIADLLTVWGDGKVNLNTVAEQTLRTYADWTEDQIQQFLEDRNRYREENKALPSDYVPAGGSFKLKSQYVKVTSTGDIYGTKYQVECILLLKDGGSVPVFWEEGAVK